MVSLCCVKERLMTTALPPLSNFGTAHFATAQLGDQRRTASLKRRPKKQKLLMKPRWQARAELLAGHGQ
jgi:hypothetical protein